MADYTVNLSESEDKAMQYVANGVQTWVDNAVHERARIAAEEIIALNTAHCNANSIAIGVGVTAQINQAYDLGVIKTAAQRHQEALDSAPPQ